MQMYFLRLKIESKIASKFWNLFSLWTIPLTGCVRTFRPRELPSDQRCGEFLFCFPWPWYLLPTRRRADFWLGNWRHFCKGNACVPKFLFVTREFFRGGTDFLKRISAYAVDFPWLWRGISFLSKRFLLLVNFTGLTEFSVLVVAWAC